MSSTDAIRSAIPAEISGMVRSVKFAEGIATIVADASGLGRSAGVQLQRELETAVGAVPGVDQVRVALMADKVVRRIVAVGSGKGGVGKSTLTANLAVAIAESGLRVGVVDADVFGFSIPGLLGIAGAKPTQVNDMILPPVAHGVKVISIGMFVEENTAVSWRGPMLHRTIQQFLTDVYFGDLDVLLIDLPPGTGDVAISLGQLLPQAEVIVVTTPQAAAAEVAERSGLVARQTGQTVIGVVENMAGLPQPDGSVLHLFGQGGGVDAAARLGVPVLAAVPLSVTLREGGDAGLPVVLSHPQDAASVVIRGLAATLSVRERGLAGRHLGLSVT